MGKEFKVGDRVAVYDCERRLVGDVSRTIDGLIAIDHMLIQGQLFNPKQCRRLIRKDRRRVWVEYNATKGIVGVYGINVLRYLGNDLVEFVEVKRK